MRELKSKPLSPEKAATLERRIVAALAKHDRGEELTEKEWTLVYWVRYAGGCPICGGKGVTIAVRPSADRP